MKQYNSLAAMIGVVELAQGRRRTGILWLGAGIGLGVLAKGPVILLHLLPAALAAPWWAPQVKQRLGRWYLDLLLGVLLGAGIALAWAVPAAVFGGEAYRHAIFWGQTAGRVSESFAHRAPFWYYLPLLPLIFFPWFVWPRFWIGLLASRSAPDREGRRYLIAWLLLTLVAFSLVSGKQAKYLVPCLPAFALLAQVLGPAQFQNRLVYAGTAAAQPAASVAAALQAAGVAVSASTSATRGEVTYGVVDTEAGIPAATVDALRALEGVVMVGVVG